MSRVFSRSRNVFQVLSLDVFHDDEKVVVGLFRGHDANDILVVHRGQKPRFLQQITQLTALLVGDLDREFLIDPSIFDEIDRTEPSAAERLEDLILAELLTKKKH